MKNILVVGSINIDMVITVDRLPNIGETIAGNNFMTVPGGKGANQALAAARLGGKVKMLGRVGNDSFGSELKQYLSDGGVDVCDIEHSDTNTGIALITVCNGDNMIVLEKGANYTITPQIIKEKESLFKWADYVIFQLEIPVKTVIEAMKCAKNNGCTVVLNPSPIEYFCEEMLEYVDIIVPNEHEGGIILKKTGASLDDAKNLVLEFAKKNIQAVVTLGGNGCVYYNENEIKHHPALKTTVVDTTAAGDSFLAGMCVALCEEKDMDSAVDFATRVASIVVSRKGAGTSLPWRSELEMC